MRRILLGLASYLLFAVIFVHFSGELSAQDWRTASREPAGLAPDPATTPEAVVQVYAARTVNWRGYFAVHTWIAVKPERAERFTIYEVTGFRLRRGGGGSAISSRDRPPDGYWYGNRPLLLADVRGTAVDRVIARIRAAVENYPYATTYRLWPGPNSNTFTAYVLRAVPELRVDLPANAIGKDYLGAIPFALTPGGRGAQVNVLGALGVMAGLDEGVEVNFAGLSLGLNPKRLALKLPLAGNLHPFGDAKPRRLED
jgi:hypothetical protein